MTPQSRPSLRTAQQLALAPQLQQSIRLLQLSSLELAEEVERALAENPFLERVDEHGASGGFEGASLPLELGSMEPAQSEPAQPEADEDAFAEVDDGWLDGLPAGPVSSESADRLPEVSAPESLADHLRRQVAELGLSPEGAAALLFLVGSLDEDGYLPDTLAELAATLVEDDDDMVRLHTLARRLHEALTYLHDLDPPGVGARNLAECLILQLQRRLQAAPAAAGGWSRPVLQAAIAVCSAAEGLAWLAAGDTRTIAEHAGVDADCARQVLSVVHALEPKPGRRFADVRRQIIVPDVRLQIVGTGAQQRFVLQLNRQAAPALQVNAYYASVLGAECSGVDVSALMRSLQEARWLVQSLQQRGQTILRVAGAIVQRQGPFFLRGELAMQPLTQTEVAAQLDLHESTVSRATTAKYMATPRGTYELKYFFGSAVATRGGGQASSTAVKALIRQWVAAEDPAQPLSDAQLAARLKAEGIDCARRTVAKYRDALQIASVRERKVRGKA